MNNDRNSLATLEALAKDIGSAGAAEDGAVGVLAKAVADLGGGMKDALQDAIAVLRMEKGGPNDPAPAHTKSSSMGKGDYDDPDTTADDHLSEDRGGSDEDEDEDEGNAGYEDMEMGSDLFDVTEFLTGLDRRQARMEKGQLAMSKALRGLQTENAKLRKLTTTVLQTQVATTAPMAKAVQELLTKLGEIPEMPMHLGVSARSISRVSPVRPVRTGTLLGTVPGSKAEKVLLAKANARNVITEHQLRVFARHGVFVDDAAANQTIVQSIQALG